MKEIILSIDEGCFKHNGATFEGFVISTNKQQIKLGITDGFSCCENSGYFMSNDNINEFIDSELLSINLVDTCLNVSKLEKYELVNNEYISTQLMFVNVETDKGTLQFTAYNEHNSYYGHRAVVISNQFKVEECL